MLKTSSSEHNLFMHKQFFLAKGQKVVSGSSTSHARNTVALSTSLNCLPASGLGTMISEIPLALIILWFGFQKGTQVQNTVSVVCDHRANLYSHWDPSFPFSSFLPFFSPCLFNIGMTIKGSEKKSNGSSQFPKSASSIRIPPYQGAPPNRLWRGQHAPSVCPVLQPQGLTGKDCGLRVCPWGLQ